VFLSQIVDLRSIYDLIRNAIKKLSASCRLSHLKKRKRIDALWSSFFNYAVCGFFKIKLLRNSFFFNCINVDFFSMIDLFLK
jgi:hypothetical protein